MVSDPVSLDFAGEPSKLMVGLCWDPNDKKQGVLDDSIQPHNLDLTCVLLGRNFDVLEMITPQNPQRQDYKYSIFHKGDHLSGGSDFEDEEIVITLDNVDAEIEALGFVISSKDNVPFYDVRDPFCVFCNAISLQSFLRVRFHSAREQHVYAALLKRDGAGWVLEEKLQDMVNFTADDFAKLVQGA